jgi:hypothetical protein
MVPAIVLMPFKENSMRLTYITHDEVNAARARELAEEAGLELIVNDIRQRPTTSWIVCDIDFLPENFIDRLLQQAAAGQDLSRVAVHSYRLTRCRARLLRSAGAAVSRRLTQRLIGRILQVQA